MVYGHLVLGERARLVGANDARRAQGLDRGQRLDEGVALAHALDGHCKRKRDRREQALGYEGNHHPKRKDEGRSDAVVNERHVKHEKDDAHEQRKDGDLLGEVIKLLLEGALLLAHVLGEARDLAKLGRHADLRHDHATVPLRDGGALENEVGGLRGSEVLVEHRIGGLAHGVGLACERRLVYLQVARANNPTVGRDLVALLEEHHVTGDEVLRKDLLLVTVTNDVHV